MNPSQGFEINLNETFPRLGAAPSIESIIYWQAPPSVKLARDTLKIELAERLPDYPICQPQQDISIQIEPSETMDGNLDFLHRTRWNGFRLQDNSTRYVAQFTPTGVIFSRLQPYETWQNFSSEAIKFWKTFLHLVKPVAMRRLGVRYINRILVKEGEELSDYLEIVPSPLPGLDLLGKSFFHRDQYQVPGYPYTVNWVQTSQPKESISGREKAIIVDIEVFTDEVIELGEEKLLQHLSEMRWVKNKIFFSCITAKALKKFK